jgi:hypothetical protein
MAGGVDVPLDVITSRWSQWTSNATRASHHFQDDNWPACSPERDVAAGNILRKNRTDSPEDLSRRGRGHLADAYRARGDLDQAHRHVTAAVASTTAAGSRFLLPDRLRGLAEIHAAQGHVAEANRIYDQAADIV